MTKAKNLSVPNFQYLAARVLNTPLMISDGKMDAIMEVFMPRFAGLPVEANSPFVNTRDLDKMKRKPLAINNQGIAVIDCCGTLVSEMNAVEPWSGQTPYQAIASDFDTAENSGMVRAIAFRFDSSGGEAKHVFDLADAIRAAKKPTIAIVSDTACSAAYLLAAACDRVFVTQNAQVGSIGVIARHVDRTAANEMVGVKITNLYMGDRKADFVEPLNAESTAEIMNLIGTTYELFVSKVVSYRGLSAETVRGQQSRIFQGASAVAEGLADEVRSEAAALAWLADETANGGQSLKSNREGEHMNRNALLTSTATILATAALAAPGTERGPAAAVQPPKAAAEPAAEDTDEGEEDKPETAPKESAAATAASAFAASNPSAAAHLRAEGMLAERDRIDGINQLCEAGEEVVRTRLINEGLDVGAAGIALANHRRAIKTQAGKLRAEELPAPVPAAASVAGAAQNPASVAQAAAAANVQVPANLSAEEAKMFAEYTRDGDAFKEFGGAPGFNAFAAWRTKTPAGKAYVPK